MNIKNIKIVKLHRQLALPLFVPLLLTGISGVAYRLGRSWLGLPKSFGQFMMTIHEGRFLGEPLVPFYVALVGLGLLALIGSGAVLWSRLRRRSPAKLPPERNIHRFLAPIAFLPLVVTASTGIAYRLSITWLGFSEEQVKFLMTLHQGSYLDSTLKPFYVLLVGAGLLIMLCTGVQMLLLARRTRREAN
ncbi:peptidase [Fischerella thermalis CCMEE 5330]|uniref:Peptidase n=1 Tax=Fischerella thermalis CCMEE 5330 TaxID=2019670 RepID=A0A2N6MLC6_9CYAN|nr:PepSY domain-containing protein [Fischerella thermalis]PMB47574.1 peptidase [Fischerella thermalis CCMEE 5330]